MPVNTPKYFVLLCPSFHGATMLSALLSNHSAICSAGDGNPATRDPNLIPCKCGRKIASCDFWQGIAGLKAAAGGPMADLWFPTTPAMMPASGNLLLAKALAMSSFRMRRDFIQSLFPRAASTFTAAKPGFASGFAGTFASGFAGDNRG